MLSRPRHDCGADVNEIGVKNRLAGSYWATNAYDGDGNLTQQQFGGVSQTQLRIDYNYTAAGQLTGETRYSDLAGTTKVATTSVVYDAAGNLTSQIDKTGGGTSIANVTNIYDAKGRITSEQLNVLPQDRIEQPTDLILAPNERTLDIGQPKPALFFGVIQETHDSAERVLDELHSAPEFLGSLPHNRYPRLAALRALRVVRRSAWQRR